MGHYEAGKKGYIVIGIAIAFIMFISLWAFVYYSNQNGLPI